MPSQIPPVVTRLKGGLGNQLFQYSFGRLISEQLSRPLLVDARTGFIHDPYKRKYALNLIGLEPVIANHAQSGACFLAQYLARKKATTESLVNTPLGQVLMENQMTTQRITLDDSQTRKLIVSGLWQRVNYVDPIRPMLLHEINSSRKKSTTIDALAQLTDYENTVVVAIRTFSESAGNHKHFLRRITGMAERIQAVLDVLGERDGIRNLVIVSTGNNALSNALSWPYGKRIEAYASDPRFDENFVFDLFRRSNHHIMLSSTLYWWASYLSGTNPTSVNRWIFDDFANSDLVPDHWSRLRFDVD